MSLIKILRKLMPLQYPYLRVTAAGTYNLDPHVQFVECIQPTGTVNLYLPPTPVPYSPLTVIGFDLGAGSPNRLVRLYTHGGRTIDNAAQFFMKNGNDIVVLYADADGHWWITQGVNVALLTLAGQALAINDSTWSKPSLLASFDATAGQWSIADQKFTPLVSGVYEFDLTAIMTGMTLTKKVRSMVRYTGPGNIIALAEYSAQNYEGDNVGAAHANAIVRVKTTESVEFLVMQENGAPGNVTATATVRRVTA